MGACFCGDTTWKKVLASARTKSIRMLPFLRATYMVRFNFWANMFNQELTP